MSEPTPAEARDVPEQAAEQVVEEPPGWRVLDPDGNVVESGPGVTLEAVSESGEGQVQQ